MTDYVAAVRPALDNSAPSSVPRPNAPSLVTLQRTLGNRAFVGLLALQRDDRNPPVAKDWNQRAQTVRGTTMRRIPVTGLKLGNQKDFVHHEKLKTAESAKGTAIVLMPGRFSIEDPFEVVLHFHGFGHRSKAEGDSYTDPFAGWRADRKTGAVRDVDQDQIPQQLAAVSSPQLLGILPQGSGGSNFNGLGADPYIAEVLLKLGEQGVIPKEREKTGSYSVVLSGHSGGGLTVNDMLGGRRAPANLTKVVLFEAIHKDLATVTGWVTGHLNRLFKVVTKKPPADPAAAAADQVAKLDAIAATPALRAYYSVGGFYQGRYVVLDNAISSWFIGHPQLAGTPYDEPLRRLFLVQGLNGTGHETVVRGLGAPGAGPLADALLPHDPTQKARALDTGPVTKAMATPRAKPPMPASGASTTAPVAPVRVAAAADGERLSAGVGRAAARHGFAGFDMGSLATRLAEGGDPLRCAADVLAGAGLRNEIDLTDALFDIVCPELEGKRIPKGRQDLADEWRSLRRSHAKPALTTVKAPLPAQPVDAQGPPDTAKAGPVAAGGATPFASKLDPAERKRLIALAQKQGASGSADVTAAMATRIRAAGSTVTDWFAGIVPDATFFDVPIAPNSGSKVAGVHQELLAKLQAAERALLGKGEHAGKTKAALGQELGIKEISGLRPPSNATGGERPSMHTYGLAIDLNYDGNPFIGRHSTVVDKKTGKKRKTPGLAALQLQGLVRRSSLLLLDDPEELLASPAKTTSEQWDRLDRQSATLKRYLALDDQALGQKVGAGIDGKDLVWWTKQLKQDRALIPKISALDKHRGQGQTFIGFMDLNKQLVEELVKVGLLWGGNYAKESGKDLMHFDWRAGHLTP